MSIESEVFKKMKFCKDKLLSYGFNLDGNCYKYNCKMKNGFTVKLVYDEFNTLTGSIYEPGLEEEYTNFRVESLKGEFVNSIREEYKNILLDIADKCCEKLYFMTPQANRIAKEIIDTYHNEPEFLWESAPDHAIFRHPENKKWYAAILYVDRSRIEKNASGMTEVLNLKIKEEELNKILTQKGFYQAYHMNKKKWISIILEEIVPDIQVMEYVKKSHFYTS
ncbi:MAG: MmcQ/YjbR family DNA-binding protein [Anaeroplasmataceae bacterium]|nr:MmcQ/YjbR family DNA-binding protein [Anaeroplasmataceae bacterium]